MTDKKSDWDEDHPQTTGNEPTSPPPGKELPDEDHNEFAPEEDDDR